LGFGYGSSRFSDPRKRQRFGVYYVGQTFEVAFLEAVVRDRRNGIPGPLVLSVAELDAYADPGLPVEAMGILDEITERGGIRDRRQIVALFMRSVALRSGTYSRSQKSANRSRWWMANPSPTLCSRSPPICLSQSRMTVQTSQVSIFRTRTFSPPSRKASKLDARTPGQNAVLRARSAY
jgi:hypothetical protein